MAKLGRSTTILCLVIGMLAFAHAEAQTRPSIAELIAKTYGVDSFGLIEAIRYTFNAQFPGVNLSRSWVWHPKTGQVSYEGKDKDGKPLKVTYVRSKLNGEPANMKDEIDPAFTNDQYWLLFPLHVYWDSSADVQDMGVQKLPLGDGSAKRVVVSTHPRVATRRYLGTLYRAGPPREGARIPSRRNQRAECRPRNLGWLPESWPTPYLDGTRRDGGWQAAANLLFECVRQACGGGQLGKCAISQR